MNAKRLTSVGVTSALLAFAVRPATAGEADNGPTPPGLPAAGTHDLAEAETNALEDSERLPERGVDALERGPELAARIPDDGLLLEFVASGPRLVSDADEPGGRYAVHLLWPTGKVASVDLGPRAPIDAAVTALRETIGACGAAGGLCSGAEWVARVRGTAREADDLIFAKLRPVIGETRHLLLAPDGALNLLPFDVLLSADGRYLAEDFLVSYFTTGRDLLRVGPNEIAAINPAVVVGGQEAAAVAAFLEGSELLTGSAAIEELHGPQILHIASPVFTAADLARVDLRGTQLVVLSAGETGAGDVGNRNGDDIYDLRRALVLAGPDAQVTSLWPVDTEATRRLTTSYYARLVLGEGRAEALREARLEMLRNPHFRNPYYWASFVPSGNWHPLGRGQSPEETQRLLEPGIELIAATAPDGADHRDGPRAVSAVADEGTGGPGLNYLAGTIFFSGLAGAAAGAVFGALAMVNDSQLSDGELRSGPENQALYDQTKTFALVGDVALATGGALVGTGVLLWLFDVGLGGPPPARIDAVPQRGGAMVGVSGEF